MTVFRPLYLPLLLCGLGTSLSAAAQRLSPPPGRRPAGALLGWTKRRLIR